MTTLLRRTDPWTVQPGWGIVVDLTPPELLNARQLRLVRRLVVGALVGVLLLCASWYVVALRDSSAADDELANAQLATTQLQRRAHAYAGVTQIQGTVAHIRTEVSGLMKGDVAVDQLLARVAGAAPAGVHLDSMSVVISQAGVAGAQDSTSALDQSGHARIGSVTVGGKAGGLDQVSTFVDRLSRITGVLDVVPTSNSQDADGGQFSIKLAVDDRVLSHFFDVKGGK